MQDVDGGHDGQEELELMDRPREESLEAEAQDFEYDLLQDCE